MTEDELNTLGQIIEHLVPKGTVWILVAIPPHEAESHPLGCCPVQTTTNIDCVHKMQSVLEGTAEMFETGDYSPMFIRPVEKTH